MAQKKNEDKIEELNGEAIDGLTDEVLEAQADESLDELSGELSDDTDSELLDEPSSEVLAELDDADSDSEYVDEIAELETDDFLNNENVDVVAPTDAAMLAQLASIDDNVAVPIVRRRTSSNNSYEARERAIKQQERIAEAENAKALKSSFQSAMHRNKILYGTVSTCEIKGDRRREVFLGVMLSQNVKVLVPFTEMFVTTPDFNSGSNGSAVTAQNLESRKRLYAAKFIGLSIPLIITHIEETDTDAVSEDTPKQMLLALGSRRKALLRIQQYNFSPDAAGNTRIQENDVVSATVISSNMRGARINVAGVDKWVSGFLLTAAYVPDFRAYYKPGDRISVQLSDIRTIGNSKNKSETTYDFECNGRVPEAFEAKKKHHLVPVGSNIIATIATIGISKRTGKILIRAWAKELGIPIVIKSIPPSAFNRKVQAGDIAEVRVTGHKDFGQVEGICHRIRKGMSTDEWVSVT